MFTGIIQAVGQIIDQQANGIDQRLHIDIGKLQRADIQIGDSIAVSGTCLTAVTLSERGFWADVSAETLACTTVGKWHIGSTVNLELALTVQTRLGGHIVSGHVDGIGQVKAFYQEGRSWRLGIEAPAPLSRYIAEKGSICVDGISLTVNKVDACYFELNIVPHTRQVTTMIDYHSGRQVNLEVDVIARYLERLLSERGAPSKTDGLSAQVLRTHGFIGQ